MKTERYFSSAVAAILGCCMALGAVGCLISGFDLPLHSTARFLLITAMVSAATAWGFSCKHGVLWVFGGWTAVLVLLIGGTELVSQCARLCYRVSYEYYLVYGWQYLTFGQELSFYVTFDHVLTVLSAAIATVVTGTVCRKRKAIAAVIMSLVPLLACLIVTHTVPKQGYLFCLFTGLIVLMLTTPLRREDAVGANRLAALVVIPTAVLVFFVLYACTPAEYVNADDEWRDRVVSWFNGDGFGNADNDNNGGGGGGHVSSSPKQTVALSFIGPRVTDHVGVAELTSTVDGVMYLREQHYTNYTGTQWEIDGDDRVQPGLVGSEDVFETLTVALMRKRERMLVPYHPKGCEDYLWDWQFKAGNVMMPSDSTEYTWYFTPLDEAEIDKKLENADIWHTSMDEGAFFLQESTSKWATPLVKEIVGDASAATAIARAIAAYVKAHGTYDLNTRAMPDGETDFVQWFLTDSETGYCVHYASAAAVLMRAAGIETHYVTGYACRVENGKAIVYADQAHAWVEYFEPALGVWIPIECTPSDPQTGAPVFAPETTKTDVQGSTVTTVPTAQSGETVTTTATHPQAVMPSPSRGIPRAVVNLGVIAAVLSTIALLVWGQYRMRRIVRERRLMCGAINQQALVVWQEIALAARFTGAPPDEAVYALAQKAKFSQHTLTTEELHTMHTYHREQIEVLRTHSIVRQLCYRAVWVVY